MASQTISQTENPIELNITITIFVVQSSTGYIKKSIIIIIFLGKNRIVYSCI